MYAFTKEMMEMETSHYLSKFWKKMSKKEIVSGFDKVMAKVKKGRVPSWDKL